MNDSLSTILQCPGCNSSIYRANILFDVLLLGEPCPVLQCFSCGLVYKGLVPTTIGLEKIYSRDYVHFQMNSHEICQAEINSAKQKLSRCHTLLGRHFIPQKARLLDIGCGSGNFVMLARSFGYLAEGIDPHLPNELHNDYLRQESPENISSNSYDIAVLLNVAEHLDKPRDMFAEVYRLLKPNGVMLLTCPYGDSLARRIYQDSWGHLALDEHLLFWTPRSLTLLLRELGFSSKISYRIAGSPFPYGLTKPQVYDNVNVVANCESSAHTSKQSPALQSHIWSLARNIQKYEITANLVRSLVHIAHIGDYLEYAIKK